ncbi:MAG TPA: hypothetical protein VK589_29960 [Chryseolinea sp.]|nr:hypothetical protein [Chryseolinea sp.]
MKIERHKDSDSKKEHDINLDTGDVNAVTPEAWNPKKRIDFEKCTYLVKKLEDGAINIIDETTVQTIAHALAVFGEKGRDMFYNVSLRQTTYDTEGLKDYFDRALRTAKYKSPTKFINICAQHGLEVLIGDDDYEYLLLEGKKPVWYTDKMTDEQIRDLQDYGFIEMRNQYYFGEKDSENKRVTLIPKSKFTIRVLYHINRGKNNKRVIVLKNNRNEQVIMEIETKEINSLQSFKSLTEGVGYFVLEPTFKEPELQRVKNKIFSEEKASKQLEVLGWNKTGFFAFCNGLYDVASATFMPVDDYGIVSMNKIHYHIPFHPGTDEYSYLNEKKIFFNDGQTKFKEWAALYATAFGDVGSVILAFTCSTVFSDHIFAVKNNFPMLFIYGEGGSGKGTGCTFAQHIFGSPQPPLKLTEKANTDKARVRKFATYCNVPIMLEEFSNSIEMAGIKTISNFYDRYGYERSSMDTRYGTETVPVRSTVMITGNEYPADDPLMQRLILLDNDRNKFTDEETKALWSLRDLNAKGITSVLIEVLSLRDGVEKTWRQAYEIEYNSFRNDCSKLEIDVPSRMIENYAVLLATHKCLEQLGISWPSGYDHFRKFLMSCLQNQAEKRNTGAVVQRFWDIVLSLASKGAIHENREFMIDGDHLFMRFKDIHTLYMEEHLRIYRQPGLLASTMSQKLKISAAWKESVAQKKFGKVNSSAFMFDYSKLNIDLIYVVNQKRSYKNEQLIETAGEQQARIIDEEKAKMVRSDEIHRQSVAKQTNVFEATPPPEDYGYPNDWK